MKRKILLLMTLLSLCNPCFAYNDYGYSYGIGNGSSGGYDSSMHVREMENDFARQQALNQSSLSSTVKGLGSSYQAPQVRESNPQSYVNPNRSYVVDKPLPLNGIYSYDAYGRR